MFAVSAAVIRDIRLLKDRISDRADKGRDALVEQIIRVCPFHFNRFRLRSSVMATDQCVRSCSSPPSTGALPPPFLSTEEEPVVLSVFFNSGTPLAEVTPSQGVSLC